MLEDDGKPLVAPFPLHPAWPVLTRKSDRETQCFAATNLILFSILYFSGFMAVVIQTSITLGLYFQNINPLLANIPLLTFIACLVVGAVFDLKRRRITGTVELGFAGAWFIMQLFYSVTLGKYTGFAGQDEPVLITTVTVALGYVSAVMWRFALTRSLDPSPDTAPDEQKAAIAAADAIIAKHDAATKDTTPLLENPKTSAI